MLASGTLKYFSSFFVIIVAIEILRLNHKSMKLDNLGKNSDLFAMVRRILEDDQEDNDNDNERHSEIIDDVCLDYGFNPNSVGNPSKTEAEIALEVDKSIKLIREYVF